MTDYCFVKSESTIGTFVTPTGEVAIPFMTLSRDLGKNWIDIREAGHSRGLGDSEEGSERPTMTIEIRAQPTYLLTFLKNSLLNTVTNSTPATGTNTRDHAFRVADEAVFTAFSMQTQEARNGVTRTLNWRGCFVNSIEFSFEQDNYGMVTLEILALEVTKTGTAFSNGNSSPAAITVTTPTAVGRSFGFPNVSINYGGTLTYDGTTKLYSVASGTALGNVESLVVSANAGAESRVFLDKDYPQSHVMGEREVTASFVLADDTPSTTWWDKVKTKTTEALFITIDNGITIETTFTQKLVITLPSFQYKEAPFDDMSGSDGVRNIEVSGVGKFNLTDDVDVHVQLRDAVATIS